MVINFVEARAHHGHHGHHDGHHGDHHHETTTTDACKYVVLTFDCLKIGLVYLMAVTTTAKMLKQSDNFRTDSTCFRTKTVRSMNRLRNIILTH